MEKKDVRANTNTIKGYKNVDPNTEKLILDLKRHFNGIIYAIARWSEAVNKTT